MSRIGKIPVEITSGVNVVLEGRALKVAGPKGELTYSVSPLIKIEIADSKIQVSPKNDSADAQSLYGLTRTLIANMVRGVSEGFEKKLEFKGVGYRANVEGKTLVMTLGYSHPIRYTPKEGIEIKVEKTTITVMGIDKQLVGQTAAEIREFRKPEPYKGKGIRYEGEYVRRKAGKTAAKGA